jgi:hypothetical protein
MAGIKEEIISSEIRATGAKAAQDEILKVKQTVDDLERAEGRLLSIKAKLENQGKKNTTEYKNNTEALNKNRQAIDDNKTKLTDLNTKLKVTDMTYNQLSKQAAILRSHLNNIAKETNPAKWNQYNQKLKETTDQMGKVRAGTQQTASTTSMLTSAMGFLGIGLGTVWAAFRFGKSVMESTDETADSLEETVRGMTSGWDYFKKSMATMDFSNFFSNMRNAIQAGRDYAQVMDEISDRERAVRMLNADEITQSKQLELIWRDRNKNSKERSAALLEWQGIQENAAKREMDISTRNYNAEIQHVADVNNIQKEGLEESLKQYIKYEADFKRLKEAGVLSAYKSAKTAIGEEGALNASLFTDADTGQARKLTEHEKLVFELFKDIGMVADSDRDKIVDLYEKMRQGEAAVLDGKLASLRAENQIENALNKTTEAVQKASDAELDRKNNLTEIYDDILAKDQEAADKYAEESQKKVNEAADYAFKLAHDRADAASKAKMEKLEEDAQNELAIYGRTTEGKKFLLEEQLRHGEISQQEYQDKITEIDSMAGQARLDVTQKLMGSASRLFRKSTIAYKLLASAEATIDTYKSATSAYASMVKIPYVGPALGAAAAAAAILQGLANVAEINKVQLWTGGYTGKGDKYKPVGTVHAGEYVVSQDELSNPHVRSIVAGVIEPMRMKRLGYSSYAQDTTLPKKGFAEGGYAGQSSTSDPELKAMISANNKLMMHLINNGVNANFDESKIYEMRQRVAKQESMDARAKS